MLRMRDEVVPRDALAREVSRVRDRLLDMERSGEIHVAESLRKASGDDILSQAMRAFRGYHTLPVVNSQADGVGLCDPNLLFYYQNRLALHGLGYNPLAAMPDGARAPVIVAPAEAHPS
jgi:glycerol-3-phosphate O-acyltransferase